MHPKYPMPPEPGIASGYVAQIVALAALASVAGIVAEPAIW
jgi:hypothetical protein